MQSILLCTDMDRTLIPNGRETESPGVRVLFSNFVNRDDVQLAYVTGRHLDLIDDAIDAYDLPTPDFAIADVGTSIYCSDNGDWQAWQPWEDDIAGDWHGRTIADIHALLADLGVLTLQEADKQNTHKLSYFVDLDVDEHAIVKAVDARLREHGIDARVIWSLDEELHIGLLDILPASASKRHAIEFLMNCGAFDVDHAVFAGDSGNDLDVLLSPMHTVLVANADPKVRATVVKASPDNTYVAEGGFLDMNGNYAAGILEGVAHFCPQFEPVLETLHGARTDAGLTA